jgi:hypothetical protein
MLMTASTGLACTLLAVRRLRMPIGHEYARISMTQARTEGDVDER